MSPKTHHASTQHFDVLLRHGTVVDGSGQPAYKADVAIEGDRVVQIGDLTDATAARELDVSGLIVAPGFIDVHSHDDAALIESPAMTPKLTQGVTTVVAGNCGISGAPVSTSGEPRGLLHLVFKSEKSVARRFENYLQKVQHAAPAINAAFLVGHTTLRMHAMDSDLRRVATAAEIASMRELLIESLEAGALGLSTGLYYPEARAASTEEVIEVARPLGKYRGLYVTHLRDEADNVLESLQEAFRIGREVDAPIIVSHHKCLGRRNFGRSVETLALLKAAARHQKVAWDVYPYTAGSTVLSDELVAQSTETVITWCDPHPEVSGHRLGDIAGAWGCSIAQAIARLQPAGAVYFMMDDTDVERIMTSSNAMIGSDGLPGDKHPHPRLWGAFPRVLGRYVRERRLLTLEDAVHRMTGLSAHRFCVDARGFIRAGYYADLCVFDAQTVRDAATYEKPAIAALGIDYVLVNGRVALDRGDTTANHAGRILRRAAQPRGSRVLS